MDKLGSACGFRTGVAKCSAKYCYDVFTKTNDADCKAYLKTCYLSASGTCAEILGCDNYYPIGSIDADKKAICNKFLDKDGKACGFKTGASKCSSKSCDDIFTKTDDAACKAYLPSCFLSAPNRC